MDSTRQPAQTKQSLAEAKKVARDRFKNERGVTGVGIGDGVLRVYILKADVANGLPNQIEGVPVEFVVTGDIKGY
jgi:hypothetical protein